MVPMSAAFWANCSMHLRRSPGGAGMHIGTMACSHMCLHDRHVNTLPCSKKSWSCCCWRSRRPAWVISMTGSVPNEWGVALLFLRAGMVRFLPGVAAWSGYWTGWYGHWWCSRDPHRCRPFGAAVWSGSMPAIASLPGWLGVQLAGWQWCGLEALTCCHVGKGCQIYMLGMFLDPGLG